ncbi:diguanylate cyclase domain-containing protein, partial [Salmonella enterica]
KLPNRTLLEDRLSQAINKAARSQGHFALMFMDLDGFKAINDSLGHHVGDRMLVEVAQRLTGAMRAHDTVARLGGDEFVILVELAQP